MNSIELREYCKEWNGSREGFSQIVSMAVRSLGLYQRELANEFQVADSTVSRWASGIARPHPRLQKMIVAYILRRAQRSTGNEQPAATYSIKRSAAV